MNTDEDFPIFMMRSSNWTSSFELTKLTSMVGKSICKVCSIGYVETKC